MKTIKQTQIAKMAGITDAFLSEILAGKKNPSWKTAKKISLALPWTNPVFWMESTSTDRRSMLTAPKGFNGDLSGSANP